MSQTSCVNSRRRLCSHSPAIRQCQSPRPRTPYDTGPTIEPMPPTACYRPDVTDVALHPTLAFSPLAIGDVIANRYELKQRLGQGGMGVVWRAYDRDMEEDVALKMLAPDQVTNAVA